MNRWIRSGAGVALALLLAACQPAPAAPTTAPTAAKPAATTAAAPAAPSPSAAVAQPAASPSASTSASPAASPAAAASPSPAAGGAVTSASKIDPSLASVWQGKTITWVVGANAGGGYDTWSRTMARYMGKYLPGNPNIIVQNMDGANHRVATNFIYAAKPDGMTIGMVDRYIPYFQLIGEGPEQGVRYDVTKINWLGSGDIGTEVMVVRAINGVSKTNLAPLEQGDWRIALQDPGSAPHLNMALSRALLGWKVHAVFGYPGNPEIALGLQRGEADGTVGDSDTQGRLLADSFANGSTVAVVQYGPAKPGEYLQGTQLMSDLLANKAADAQLFELGRVPMRFSRPFLAPPGMADNMVATFRAAVLLTLQDPDFRADMVKARIDVNPVSGEDVQQLVEDYLKTPKSQVDRLQAEMAKDVQQ